VPAPVAGGRPVARRRRPRRRRDVNAARRQARLVVAAAAVGVASGLASAGFLVTLERATEWHADHGWSIWLLPVGGALVVWVQTRWGGRAREGNRLTLSQIRRLDDGVPVRLAPLVYAGTLVTHVLGGSAGREGTALQMAAGLTDGPAARAGFGADERRLLLAASLAAGFGSVFGVPWAGAVFAIEVSPLDRGRRVEVVPAVVVAAIVGDAIVRVVGVHHTAFPSVAGLGLSDVGASVLVAPLFGVAAWWFLWAAEGVKAVLAHRIGAAPWRPVVGGALVVALTLLVGSQTYNGLSLPLLTRSFALLDVGLGVWALKLVFTAVTVGSGFAGGEVTPLFVIGATLGAAVGHAVGGPVLAFAAVGMVATFGAAANAPLASMVMGVELFGWGAALPLVLGCLVARLCSSRRSLYQHADEPVGEDAALL